MKVHFGLPARDLPRSWLTIGSYDGVHRGHARVLSLLTRRARATGAAPVVLTFDPHPRCVLTPDSCPPSLTTVDEKAEVLEALGVEHLIVLEFTRKTSELTATEFIEMITARVPLRGMVIGYDFSFGHQRRGNREFLANYGDRHGFELEVVQAHSRGGEVISSTRIRGLLLEGRIAPANQLLGREYSLSTFIEHGTETGSRIGYPTANFAITPNKLVPRTGVYAVWVDVDGMPYQGAMNIGYRPTFGENRLTVEAFLLDFSGNLYGRRLRARFVQRVRDERRFESVDALVGQIGRDVQRVRDILAR